LVSLFYLVNSEKQMCENIIIKKSFSDFIRIF
jgi:hypothetical protein